MRATQPGWLMLAMLATVLGGCSSATVTNTWKNPDFTGPIHFNKVVVLANHPDGTVRRVAEDEMAAQIPGGRGVPGYTVLSDDDRGDINKVKAKLQAAGVDGAVTMQLLGKRQETTYVPGSPSYGSFYDYYGGAMMGSPGYVVSDTIASVETKIYSINDGKLIWSGTTDTFNPSDIRSNVRDIAKALGAELRKQGLLAKESS
jgi:hypothetical protein